jgi:hypothetical protein
LKAGAFASPLRGNLVAHRFSYDAQSALKSSNLSRGPARCASVQTQTTGAAPAKPEKRQTTRFTAFIVNLTEPFGRERFD